MRMIWKYPVKPNSIADSYQRITIEAPQGSKPLCVMKQGDQVCLWLEVETARLKEPMHFGCVGTGHGQIPPGDYVGSVIDGPYVWHFYRLR